MEELQHKYFTMVAIKSDDKYLFYRSNSWQTYLLPYYQTIADPEEERKEIKKELKDRFGFDVTLSLLTEETYEKYSYHDPDFPVKRIYTHRVYEGRIEEKIKKELFFLNGREYRWIPLRLLKNNEDFMKKNGDVYRMLTSEKP